MKTAIGAGLKNEKKPETPYAQNKRTLSVR